MKNPFLFLAAILLAASARSGAADPPPWPKAVRDLGSRAGVDAASLDFPNSSGLQRRRAAAALDAGDKAALVDAVRRLAEMGATLSAATRDRIAKVTGAPAMAALAASFEANAAPAGASRLYASIPADQRLIEGLVWEPGSRRLYATSVVGRRLLAVEPDGGTRVAAGEGLGGLFGGAWDASRGRIWVASAAIEQTPRGGVRFEGLVGFDRKDPRRQIRLPAPPGASLGDVAVAPDGIVYASDGLHGGIYRCRRDCVRLETWLPPGTFASAQGMAVSRDGKWLYVADYSYGLAAVERASGRIVRIPAPPSTMLDGIDGLVRWGRDLIAVQNGVGTSRIVRLRLDPDGLAVVRLDVLERKGVGWGEPSLATLAGNRLLYVADPQWEHYGAGGAATSETPAHATPIRMIDLANLLH